MKSKISLTLEDSLLDRIDIDMKKHRQYNRSKFIEFVLRQVLYNKETQLKLLIKKREAFLREFKVLNEEILTLEESIPQIEEEESETVEEEPPRQEKSLMMERPF